MPTSDGGDFQPCCLGRTGFDEGIRKVGGEGLRSMGEGMRVKEDYSWKGTDRTHVDIAIHITNQRQVFRL